MGWFSPWPQTIKSLRANLLNAADEVIARYEDSSDPALDNFDWAKAQACLKHALELQPDDAESRAKLAASTGFAQLAHDSQSQSSVQAATRDFDQAVAIDPRLPLPHLGQARIDVYSLHNVGMAMAQFHEAERLGFHPGPREFEQQADGYYFRARQEFEQWRAAPHAPKAQQQHFLLLAQRDLDR